MSELINIKDEKEFDQVLQSELPVLIDFWAPWCGPCIAMTPILSELASTYKAKLIVGKVNIDEVPTLASKYGIGSIPNFILFQSGEQLGAVVGRQTQSMLVAFLKRHLASL